MAPVRVPQACFASQAFSNDENALYCYPFRNVPGGPDSAAAARRNGDRPDQLVSKRDRGQGFLLDLVNPTGIGVVGEDSFRIRIPVVFGQVPVGATKRRFRLVLLSLKGDWPFLRKAAGLQTGFTVQCDGNYRLDSSVLLDGY